MSIAFWKQAGADALEAAACCSVAFTVDANCINPADERLQLTHSKLMPTIAVDTETQERLAPS